ncbi:hypothetical protein SVAN01_10450 [Stagonosporopsis vannaccii]|nr:hypothetical protein SVAN01_10450 [Stagonosporopsis vannaccii]
MSQPVTEIVYLPIKKDVSLDSGDGKSIWDAFLKIIASQKGFKRLAWGPQIENPSIVQMAIDWESLDAHKAFMASDAYGPFLDRLPPIQAGPPSLFHLTFPSSPDSGTYPFDAPVTECLSMYFDPSHDSATFDKSYLTFVAGMGRVQGSEATGFIGGWSVETHKVDGEGEEKKLFGAFIGWPTVEAHMELRKTEEFPKLVGYLRAGTSGIKMHHVAFRKYEG